MPVQNVFSPSYTMELQWTVALQLERAIIDPGVLQKLTVEGATIQLAEIGVTVPQHALLTLMVQEIWDQQLQGQFKQWPL